MKLTKFQKLRIKILISVTVLGFLGCYIWYNRTIDILEVPVIARMQRSGFSSKIIAILPMGKIKISDIQDLKILLKKLYQINVKILKPIEIPKKGFNELTKQYSAADINDHLAKKRGHYFRLIGIIDKDMTVGAYNFVFGLASLSRGVFTVSISRLQESFYGNQKNASLFRSRLFKIITHEYGHTFGLGHCQGKGACLMKFINGINDLDSFSCGFCWICNQRVVPND